MNPTSDQDIPLQAGTPLWLKRGLLFCLFGLCLAGYVSGSLNITTLTKRACELFNSKVVPNTPNFSDLSSRLMEKISLGTENGKPITFQGMLAGDHGDTLIMINGRLAVKGAVIDGARVVDITKSNVLIECAGETVILYPGERFVPQKTAK